MDSDILELIDQIEMIVNTAPKVPMLSKVMVDAEAIVELCERLRLTIPRDITRARRVIEEYEHRLAQARPGPTSPSPTEGERGRRGDGATISPSPRLPVAPSGVASGEEGRAREIVEEAERRARDLIDQAEREAAARRADADAYTVEVLHRLDRQLSGLLTSVRKGLETLDAAKSKP